MGACGRRDRRRRGGGSDWSAAGPPVAAPPLEDLEVVAGAENLDLLQDVEFYTWLADQSALPADANSG